MYDYLILELKKKIISFYNCEYNSFVDSYKLLTFDDYYIDYDAQTLLINNTNINKKDYIRAFRDIYSELKFGKEAEKEFLERRTLYKFLKRINHLEAIITKATRPDYVITINNLTIGIEITKFTDAVDQICGKVLALQKGKNYTVEEMKENAKQVSVKFADYYEYYNIDGVHAVGTKMFSPQAKFDYYSNELSSKYNKYESLASNYDMFIVLCDATSSMLTEFYEAEAIINNSGEIPNKIISCIMFLDNTGIEFRLTNEDNIQNKL